MWVGAVGRVGAGWGGGVSVGESCFNQRANKDEEMADVLPRGRFKGRVWTFQRHIVKLCFVRVEKSILKEGQSMRGWSGGGGGGEHPAASVQ